MQFQQFVPLYCWVFHCIDAPQIFFLFICLLFERHSGCFQVLVIVNRAAVDIHVQVLCEHVFISLWKILRREITGSYGKGVFNFIKKLPSYFSRMALPFCIPPSNVWEISFLLVIASICFFSLFVCLFVCRTNIELAISPHGFNLHLPASYLYQISSEVTVQILCLFSEFFFLFLEFWVFFIYFGKQVHFLICDL